MVDIIIIGAGPAGLTAAIYAARFGKSVLVFESLTCGGQLLNTPEVENYPAVKSIAGWELAQNMFEQVRSQGVEVKFEQVLSINAEKDIKTIYTSENKYETKSIIIANGAKRRKLGCEGEERLTGRGVSYCATCDGAFFKNKKVAIVGGGNTALEDALFLSSLCDTVYVIHRRDSFKGDKYLINALKTKENIEYKFFYKVTEILGKDSVNSIKLLNLKDNSSSSLDVDGIFIAIGMQPDNQIFSSVVSLDEAGYIKTDENCKTNIDGIYAAGDTRGKPVRQIVTATADGAICATNAANFVNLSY